MTVIALQDIVCVTPQRISTTWDELDWAYGSKGSGWGFPGSAISLWAGSPGVGKTRLIVELAKRMDQSGKTVLIFQGEVSPQQFKSEKMMDYVPISGIWISSDVAIDEQMKIIQELKPDLVITDSVQQVDEYQGGRGAKLLVNKMKKAISYGGHVIFISQLTAEGKTAGGNKLPHFVDILCSVDNYITKSIFKIEIMKNRCGVNGRWVIFEHHNEGVICASEGGKALRWRDVDWIETHVPPAPFAVPPAPQRPWWKMLFSIFL